MNKSQTKTVGELGELALIELLKRQLPRRADICVGAGDDCAVVNPVISNQYSVISNSNNRQPITDYRLPITDYDLVLKSDPVIEGRHFNKGDAMRRVGHKAVGRVLSDFAAMGAEPRWGLVNLVLRSDVAVRDVQELYRGMTALGKRFGFAIVGGDTATGNEIAVHVCGVGTLPRGSARLRSMAKAGDMIYVTGKLGGSFKSGKHLDFEPRVKEGIFLRTWANAMIDVSDGLASELWHIAKASKVTLRVESEGVPLAVSSKRLAVSSEKLPLTAYCSPLTSALCDGEDFELLFTVSRKKVEAFEKAWRNAFKKLPCTCIGTVEKGRGRVLLDGKILKLKGYEHFRH